MPDHTQSNNITRHLVDASSQGSADADAGEPMGLRDSNDISRQLDDVSTQESADAGTGEPIGLRDKRGTTEGASYHRLSFAAAVAVGDAPAVGECTDACDADGRLCVIFVLRRICISALADVRPNPLLSREVEETSIYAPCLRAPPRTRID